MLTVSPFSWHHSNTERQDEEESSAAPGGRASETAVSHQALAQQADPDVRAGAALGGVRDGRPHPPPQHLRQAAGGVRRRPGRPGDGGVPQQQGERRQAAAAGPPSVGAAKKQQGEKERRPRNFGARRRGRAADGRSSWPQASRTQIPHRGI